MALTAQYFNEKYKSRIPDACSGLLINHPKVVEYLNRVFKGGYVDIVRIGLNKGVPEVMVGLEEDPELPSKLAQDISNIMEYYNNPYPERVFNK